MLFQKTIDEFNRNTRTGGDALLSRGFEKIRIFAFTRRHRIDDGNLLFDHFAIEMRRRNLAFHFGDTGDHPHETANTTDLFNLLQLIAHITEIKLAFAHPLRGAHGFFLIDILNGFFNERNNITHAENAIGNTRGMKLFERIYFFAGTDKLDRLSCNRAHGECRTTTAIAINACEHNAGNANALFKSFCGIDRILTRQCISDEQHFMRLGE